MTRIASESAGNWKIQKMAQPDLDEVILIETSNSLTPWSSNMFLAEMQNPFSHCFVVKREEGEKSPVIGFICFRNAAGESELLNLSIHPDVQQRGLGKTLMQFYIDFCNSHHIGTCYLEVNASNQSALRLYHRFSFQSFGRRKNFYQGKFDAVLMKKEV